MTTLPAITRTWKQLLTTGVPGQRISFVSVLDAMQNTLYGLKNFLVSTSGATTKYQVVWTASGGTGPANSADSTDRWSGAAAITPRATVAAASQAWCLLLAGNAQPVWTINTVYAQGTYVTNGGNVYICRTAGTSAGSGGPTTTAADIVDNTAHWQFLQVGTGQTQILLAFQGASDDICRISFSPGALFVLAGTTNNQPTATDEQVFLSATTIVNATASADRILHVWASDDAHAFRALVMRSSVVVSPAFGVEDFQAGVTSFPVNGSASVATLPRATWGFAFVNSLMTAAQITAAAYSTTAGSNYGGLVRALVSSSFFSCSTLLGGEASGLGAGDHSFFTFQPELQGGAGYIPWPLGMVTNTAGARGRLGNPVDWWAVSPSGGVVGDGLGASYQFWQVGTSVIWPNPSNAAPTLT
jgi:hypothetical protein